MSIPNSVLLRSIDIRRELERYGLNSGKISNGNLMLCCPIHGEKNPSFGIGIDETKGKYGIFNCYSCGENGDFFKLLSILRNEDYFKVKAEYEVKIDILNDLQGMKKIFDKKLMLGVEGRKFLKESQLDKFNKLYGEYLNYVKGRRINGDTINNFGLLCSDNSDDDFYERVIIPIRDVDGKLIAVSARSIKKNIHKKYKVRKSKGSQSKEILFGLNILIENNYFGKDYLILVEGEFDCMWLQQNGYPAVAIQSIFISNGQLKRLQNLDIEKIYIMLDGDQEEFVSCKLADRLNKYFTCIIMDIDCDPDELSKEELRSLFK